MGGVSNNRESLRDDLLAAAKRPLRNFYKQAGGKDEREYPTLARIVKTVVGEQRWRARPNQSLLDVVWDAIQALPEELSLRAGRETDLPVPARGKPVRDIAAMLYGYKEDTLPPRYHAGGHAVDDRTYNHDYYPAALRLAGVEYASETTQKRLAAIIREDLADVLLAMERNAIEQRERSAGVPHEDERTDTTLIDRPEYIDRLHALVVAGHTIICIWGEPGTGKSTLAAQFSRRLARDTPVPVVRCAPMLEAITPEAEIFRQDLALALVAEGVDPARVDRAMWFSQLCEQLAEQPRSNAVVLDNIETAEDIDQIIRAQPKIPVIITMRARPTRPEVACEELGNFTASQAREFIRHYLPDGDDEDTKALAHVLGCRPLALEHAVRFVQESPDVSLKTLVHGLVTKVTDTLSVVTPFEELERNLARLYGLIVASLERHGDARAVLDSFLAVVGGNGVGYREVVDLFLQSEVGGSHDRLHFRSALRGLGRLGLVREEQNVMGRQPQESGLAERPQLVMHALTYAILRDLRGPGTLALESRYWDWVLQGGHQALPEDDTNAHEHAYLALLQWSLRVASGGLPRGWASMVCADDRTWIALMDAEGDSEPTGTYVVRYVVRPDGVYKLDYRSGRWSSVEGQEAAMLFLLITIHYERIHNGLQTERSLLMDEEPQPEQPRLDDEVTPADGYRHIIIEPLALETYRGRSEWSLWAVCGKRFMASSAETTADVCPDCESLRNSAERRRDIEAAVRSRYFIALDYKDPVAAARLFLMRAKLRRELDRPIEAADDLDRAYSFLLIATDVPEGDVLILGLGLISEAGRLPESHRRLTLRVYDHLLWRFKDRPGAIQSARVRLQLERAKLLEWWGQAADALAGYRAIVSKADAGQSGAPVNVTMFSVLWEREHAERKLGLTDDANKSMRRVIAEAERERGEGRLLIACLMYSGAYLVGENPRQAREDLQRALRIAGAQQPPDYENMWDCLIKLSNVELVLGSTTSALAALEVALEIAHDHLPQRVQQTEQAIARARERGAGDPR